MYFMSSTLIRRLIGYLNILSSTTLSQYKVFMNKIIIVIIPYIRQTERETPFGMLKVGMAETLVPRVLGFD